MQKKRRSGRASTKTIRQTSGGSAGERCRSALGVSSLCNNYFCVVREQRPTAGDDDGMVIDDQNACRLLCRAVLRGVV